jgi:hypothetical protein
MKIMRLPSRFLNQAHQRETDRGCSLEDQDGGHANGNQSGGQADQTGVQALGADARRPEDRFSRRENQCPSDPREGEISNRGCGEAQRLGDVSDEKDLCRQTRERENGGNEQQGGHRQVR